MATKLESLDEDMLLTLLEKLRTWDANFRVITDMIAKMNELQKDVRELKTIREPQSPASPPVTQQETVQPGGYPQPIKLKVSTSIRRTSTLSISIFKSMRARTKHGS